MGAIIRHQLELQAADRRIAAPLPNFGTNCYQHQKEKPGCSLSHIHLLAKTSSAIAALTHATALSRISLNRIINIGYAVSRVKTWFLVIT